MVVYHFLVQEILGGKEYQDIDIDEASRAIAGIWLEGMLPREDNHGKAKPTRPTPLQGCQGGDRPGRIGDEYAEREAKPCSED